LPATTYVVIDTMSVTTMFAASRIALMLAHTCSACAPRSSGVEPSGAVGTTPAVYSIVEPAGTRMACEYGAAGGAMPGGLMASFT
jgi:hypothetical protein